ncbi:S-phase kinase-associated protein 1 [Taenia solium]|eukprot:TsM_000148200 transcript=TsM_000148200 gene=TsM_000148200
MPVKLVTSDKVVFDVHLEITRKSVVIRDILDGTYLITNVTSQTNHPFSIVPLLISVVDVGPEAAEDNEPISLQCVNAAVSRKVLQWCTHHKDDVPHQGHDDNRDRRTGDMSKTFLMRVAKTIANMIRGEKLKKICKTLNIKSKRHSSRGRADNLDELMLSTPNIVLPDFSDSSCCG